MNTIDLFRIFSCFLTKQPPPIIHFIINHLFKKQKSNLKKHTSLNKNVTKESFFVKGYNTGNFGEYDIFCQINKKYKNKLCFKSNIKFSY